MRKNLILLLILLIFNCSNNLIKKVNEPKNLISKSKMVDIIYDMTLISVAKGVNKSVLEKNGIIPENYIFSKYNIDSLIFAQSNEYYSYDLEIYQSIYKDVKIKLENNKKKLSDSIMLMKEKSAELSKKRIDKKKKLSADSLNIELAEKIKSINSN